VVGRLADFDFELVPNAVLVLNVLRAAHASEDAATHHDSKLGRQGFGLLHGVRREDDSRLLVPLADLLDHLPHEAPGFGVHARRGLIEQDDGRVANQGHGDGQLSLVSAAQGARELVPMVLQVQVTDCLLDDRLDLVGADALDKCIELQSLLDGHHGEDGVVLGTVPNQLSRILELLLNVEALDSDLASRWCDLASQTLERGGLSSTIDSEQREALAVVKAEAGLLDSADRCATRRVVLLLEVVHSDAVNVVRINFPAG